jgi:hypothetical protein
MLRYDADRLGDAIGNNEDARFFAWGPLRVFFTVRLEDRFVELGGVGLNTEWQP